VEHLWSPWRLPYVTGAAGADRDVNCIFCENSPDRERLILIRGRLTYVILNKYPYNNGHLMVAPIRHVATLSATTEDERSELMRFTRHAEMALSEAYIPQGVNIGINLGRPAGAGIVDHLHVHVVPRWSGDTSFISVIGNTRVLPEALDSTAARLRPIFERLANDERVA
jgi:ATP adenylyltransferase